MRVRGRADDEFVYLFTFRMCVFEQNSFQQEAMFIFLTGMQYAHTKHIINSAYTHPSTSFYLMQTSFILVLLLFLSSLFGKQLTSKCDKTKFFQKTQQGSCMYSHSYPATMCVSCLLFSLEASSLLLIVFLLKFFTEICEMFNINTFCKRDCVSYREILKFIFRDILCSQLALCKVVNARVDVFIVCEVREVLLLSIFAFCEMKFFTILWDFKSFWTRLLNKVNLILIGWVNLISKISLFRNIFFGKCLNFKQAISVSKVRFCYENDFK